MIANASPTQIKTVTSKDGTSIGYHQLGAGPGLVLVQGTMGTAQNFMQLAHLLADTFTIYVPDRRGRGLSATANGDYGVQKEVDDLEVLLSETGTQHVFGLSAGAIITLEAALRLPAIRKAVIYEPPFFVNGAPVEMVKRYQGEMAQGKVAAALVTAMKASQLGPSFFNAVPSWMLAPLINMGLKSEDRKGAGEYLTMRALAPTLQRDFQLVLETDGKLERYRDIGTDVLLLGGSTSPAYLKTALDKLEKILPHNSRIELPGVGHAAPWNSDKDGHPERVAPELKRFFS